MRAVLYAAIGLVPFTLRKVDLMAIKSGISQLTDRLGVDVDVQISETTEPHFVTVNHEICYYPDTLPIQVEHYVQNCNLTDHEYWSTLIQAVLYNQPQLLITDEIVLQVFPALQSDKTPGGEDSRNRCKKLLGELLELKISLQDKNTLSEMADVYLAEDPVFWNGFREELITRLNKGVFSIQVHPDYFRQIFYTPADDNLFSVLRDEIFNESGITVPDLRMAFDASLPIGMYYFSYNAYYTVPDKVVKDHMPPGTSDGLRGLLILFKAFLKEHVFTCIDFKYVDRQFSLLQGAHPDLVFFITDPAYYPLTIKVIRLLAREGISIRNLPMILEAILSSDYIIGDDQQYIIFDDRIATKPLTTKSWKQNANQVVEFVRIRMKRQISYQYSLGESTLNVYLLDPEIEKWVDASTYDMLRSDASMIERIHSSIGNELKALGPDSRRPVVLTINKVRQSIHDIIASRFPEVHVLGYQELSPDMNIQAVARITIS